MIAYRHEKRCPVKNPTGKREPSNPTPTERIRGGVISGRVITVLAVSLFLCALAAIGLWIWWESSNAGLAP